MWALLLGFGAAIAWPVSEGLREAGSCEPEGWVDWHVAMKQSCLTADYVCRNMTSEKLLEDPEVMGEVRRALQSGDADAFGALDALVGSMRAQYGCEGAARSEAPARSAPAHPRLPPGHPPIGPEHDAPRFDAPSGVDI